MDDLEMEELEARLRSALVSAPAPDAKARSRARLLDATLPSRAPRRATRRRRLVAPLAAAMIALSATGAAAVPASAHAIPGDPLFGIRMATESIRLSLAGDTRDEAAIRLAIARARAIDLERALAKRRDAAIDELSRRFFAQIRALRALGSRAQDLGIDIEAQEARIDRIAERVENEDDGRDRGRAARVRRDLRKHDDRGRGRSDDPRPGNSGKGRSGDDDDREHDGSRDGSSGRGSADGSGGRAPDGRPTTDTDTADDDDGEGSSGGKDDGNRGSGSDGDRDDEKDQDERD